MVVYLGNGGTRADVITEPTRGCWSNPTSHSSVVVVWAETAAARAKTLSAEVYILLLNMCWKGFCGWLVEAFVGHELINAIISARK